jgi:hypothetical protein
MQDLSRRHFLGTVGAVLIAGPGASAQSSTAGHPATPTTGIRVGVDTDKQPAAIKAKGALAMLDYVRENRFDGACSV